MMAKNGVSRVFIAGLIGISIFSSGIYSAQAASSPHSPVSSDPSYKPGSTYDPNIKIDNNGAYSKAFKGTGTPGGSVQAKPIKESPAGPPYSPKSVIGSDERTSVTDTTAFPYRAIVHISSSIGSCTGWLIGPKTVATAGHCVYDTASRSFAGTATVSPGRNGSAYPYGSVTSTRYFIPSGWQSGNSNYDYAAIELSQPIGNTVGYFGYSYTASSLAGANVTISGYPGDKTTGTQWQMSGTIALSETYKLQYAIDTYGGQSGSPVYEKSSSRTNCSGPCSLAVHTNGVYGGSSYNRGTRITKEVFDNFTSWKNSAQ
ncbi:trypsin-like serine protease [Bacillus glycinifermentans]|uniref:trypsin-like serine peptidase n=2 Tax=Bacillaceae TaxID=186817 RepID=UPI0015842E40|nr:serine protease [Bacillus glycinifermentans]MBU8785919.1 trypsin-like serine protease [Bacillus glycinifermentans]